MSGVASGWYQLLVLPEGIPPGLVVAGAWILATVMVIFPVAAAYSYVERKLGADYQARVGPNRAGPSGMFQPIADWLKLLQKPNQALSWKEERWSALQTMATYSTAAVLPLGPLFILADTEMNVFIPFWALMVAALATLLLGMEQSSIQGWLGGSRVAAQALSGAFPATLAILCAGLAGGGFRWADMVASQGAAPWSWNVMASPFHPFGFLAFVGAGLVFSADHQRDLGGGVTSNLYGGRLALAQLGKFYVLFLWSSMATVLYLGGWSMPAFITEELSAADAWIVLFGLQAVLVLSKTVLLMFLIDWVARTNPRARVEQITELSWKFLSPLALFSLMGAAAWRALT